MKSNLALVLALATSTTFAADIENGDDLHFTHCTGCHDDSAYTREDRRVNTFDRLVKQVRFCKDSLELSWFDEDVDDVAEYLNRTYYHF